MARFSLIPREEQFFTDFVGLAEQIRGGARLLKQMLAVNPPDADKVEAIKDIEHACDKITRTILDRLNRTFVTPLDREDIHALASSLDDVMDGIDAAAAVIRLYRIQVVRPGAKRLAEIIVESADRLTEGMASLEKDSKLVLEIAARVGQLEHEADRVHQDAIVELFDQETDPIAVIKWKEVFDLLEAATDRCEDVANLLQGIVVKHG
jgi:predicted phosphate transport protein (TIGR00153 family)